MCSGRATVVVFHNFVFEYRDSSLVPKKVGISNSCVLQYASLCIVTPCGYSSPIVLGNVLIFVFPLQTIIFWARYVLYRAPQVTTPSETVLDAGAPLFPYGAPLLWICTNNQCNSHTIFDVCMYRIWQVVDILSVGFAVYNVIPLFHVPTNKTRIFLRSHRARGEGGVYRPHLSVCVVHQPFNMHHTIHDASQNKRPMCGASTLWCTRPSTSMAQQTLHDDASTIWCLKPNRLQEYIPVILGDGHSFIFFKGTHACFGHGGPIGRRKRYNIPVMSRAPFNGIVQ